MSEILPLFPLQLVAFPGENLNLHVFEPRYRQLVKECEEGSTFGIPAFIDGRVKELGTEMELVNVEKTYADGRMDVKTKGVQVFRIEEFYSRAPGKLYAGATITPLEYENDGDILQSNKIVEKITELFDILKINKAIPDPSNFFTFDMAHHVGLTVEQEYEILSIRSEEDRQDFMLEHLEKLIPIVKEMEELRKRVQMNGHFKNIIPPQI